MSEFSGSLPVSRRTYPLEPGVPSSRVKQAMRRPAEGEDVNVGQVERMASVAGGSGLVLYGLTRGTLGGFGLAALGGALVYRGVTGRCPCYQALGLDTAHADGPHDSVAAQSGERVDLTISILRPREEIYRYWRELSNLPHIMRHLESVRPTGGAISHWVANGPLGTKVEWDAEIISERENELIAWRSLGDSDVDTAGSVHFAPAANGRATTLRVVLKYNPPAGKLGTAVASLLGESPEEQIREDLAHFKQIMEAGITAATNAPPRIARPDQGEA